MLCNQFGLPLKFALTAGQDSDCKQAIPLLKKEKAQYVIADKGYDSTEIVTYIEKQMKGALAVIPSRINRKHERFYDRELYKKRNLIERLFSRLKQFRRLATRYCKLQNHYSSFLSLACAFIWSC